MVRERLLGDHQAGGVGGGMPCQPLQSPSDGHQFADLRIGVGHFPETRFLGQRLIQRDVELRRD